MQRSRNSLLFEDEWGTPEQKSKSALPPPPTPQPIETVQVYQLIVTARAYDEYYEHHIYFVPKRYFDAGPDLSHDPSHEDIKAVVVAAEEKSGDSKNNDDQGVCTQIGEPNSGIWRVTFIADPPLDDSDREQMQYKERSRYNTLPQNMAIKRVYVRFDYS